MINQEHLENFVNKFPLFLPTIEKLNKNSIPWVLCGSGSLYLLGNKREPADVDIGILNKDHDKVDELFGIKSYIYELGIEKFRNSNPFKNGSAEITSSIFLIVDNQMYDCSDTDETMNHRIITKYKDQNIYIKAPEDVLLIKALHQRGQNVGKNDIEDIDNFLKIYKSFDKEYLNSRIKELNAEQRIGNIFNVN